MKNNARFSITTVQKSGGETDRFETFALGSVEKSGETCTFRYTEDGKQKVSSTITVSDGGSAVIERNGDFSSKIFLEKNELKPFEYSTPFGTLNMAALADTIILNSESLGGKILFRYTLYNDGIVFSENEVTVSYQIEQ